MFMNHPMGANADSGIAHSSPDHVNPVLRDLAESTQTVVQFVDLVQKLAEASDLGQILDIVARSARKLHRAEAATIILRQGNEVLYAAQDACDDAAQPLWLGQRLPADECISGWVMGHATAVSIFDVDKDIRIPAERYKATWVRSMAMVPIRANPSLGAIGLYWSTPHHTTQEQLRLLQALADASTIAIGKCRIQDEMEILVQQRTRELETANRELRKDALLRRQMEAKIVHLSLTDELTSLNNRRGFLLRADQLFKLMHRVKTRAWLVYVDIDNLKKVNDECGHEAGDRLIRGAAKVLKESFRDSDVIGRIGGDEFVVFATGSSTPLTEIHDRLERNVMHFNSFSPGHPELSLSIGTIRCEPRASQTLEELIGLADAAMYVEKRAKRKPPGTEGPD